MEKHSQGLALRDLVGKISTETSQCHFCLPATSDVVCNPVRQGRLGCAFQVDLRFSSYHLPLTCCVAVLFSSDEWPLSCGMSQRPNQPRCRRSSNIRSDLAVLEPNIQPFHGISSGALPEVALVFIEMRRTCNTLCGHVSYPRPSKWAVRGGRGAGRVGDSHPSWDVDLL